MNPRPATPPSPRKILFATAAGNFVEWLDFSLYGYLAVVISRTFFPPGSQAAALIGAFAVYGVAFIARPIGALVFSRIGDHRGRRSALSLCIIVMGTATAAIGILPSYGTVGILAPILLLLCRLAEGFSAGGEYAGGMIFALEHSSERRRATRTNFVASFANGGSLGGIVVIIVFQTLLPQTYTTNGWRWAFVVAGAVALVGLYLRRRIDETPVYREFAAARTPVPLRTVLREHRAKMGVLFVFYALGGVLNYMIVGYMPTFLTATVKIKPLPALFIQGTILLFGMLLFMGLGPLIDSGRVTRRRLLLWGAGSSVFFALPAYLMISTANVGVALLGLALLEISVITTAGGGALIALEMMPAEVRYAGVAIPYNLASALFAGTAPLISQLLVQASGSKIMPAVYATIVALIAFPVIYRGMPDTAGRSIRAAVAVPERVQR
ncbi:MFS transporter [Amycolatopsis rhabdoformis]|uniref:MFS transporter n=1 Tax=Amycolatopsis rhabdoformis TaxID=1448059 RepID=A0ABZ1IJE6_9PSEU|nr:MFS transporter [Amycolatopsis rhabdoformis]WSE34516.1 MFS transporter [Amycolatopsis rhabdoformis]